MDALDQIKDPLPFRLYLMAIAYETQLNLLPETGSSTMPDSRAAALTFWEGLPTEVESPERALAFRTLASEAGRSSDVRDVLCAIYAQLAENKLGPITLSDSMMLVSSITECLEVMPMIESDLNEFIARQSNGQILGLWQYVRELYLQRSSRLAKE